MNTVVSAATISITSGNMPIITDGSGEDFTSGVSLSGTLNVDVGAFDYVIVGGGAGGGSGGSGTTQAAGGGGAGGVATSALGMSGLDAASYSVTVGGGGTGASPGRNNGGNGVASSIATVASAAGGTGGKAPTNGNGGASGSPTAHSAGTGSNGGGGGGGAGVNGSNNSGSTGGKGGNGLSVNLNGWSVGTFGGGGGGGKGNSGSGPGAGGTGGGGKGGGSGVLAIDGTTNTGGGGGGGASALYTTANRAGGDGGSGVVYTRYFGSTAATGGSITDNGEFTVHRFTGSGTFGGLIDASSMVATFSGDLSSTGSLVKDGAGTLILSGSNDYSGSTSINGGTLLVNGSHTGGGTYTVKSGATLGGTGSTDAAVVVELGGILSAGTSPGLFSTGSLTLDAGSTFEVEIDGLLAGTQYDQTVVAGAVDLTDSLLDISLGFGPPSGSMFTIIDNNDADLVTGTFSGLAEGAVFSDGGGLWSISYVGGTGNDVVLTSVTIPEPSTLILATLGLLSLGITRRRRR